MLADQRFASDLEDNDSERDLYHDIEQLRLAKTATTKVLHLPVQNRVAVTIGVDAKVHACLLPEREHFEGSAPRIV